jgi:hypothetical protein
MSVAVVGHEMHNELLEQLESIGQWWPDHSQASVSAMNAREVMTRLTELRTVLKEHFQAEETQGLLPNGPAADPRFARDVERLLAQHGGLVDRLNAVIGSIPLVSDHTQSWSIAKEHFDNFRKQLEAHERAEIGLLQSACGDNLGVGD